MEDKQFDGIIESSVKNSEVDKPNIPKTEKDQTYQIDETVKKCEEIMVQISNVLWKQEMLKIIYKNEEARRNMYDDIIRNTTLIPAEYLNIEPFTTVEEEKKKQILQQNIKDLKKEIYTAKLNIEMHQNGGDQFSSSTIRAEKVHSVTITTLQNQVHEIEKQIREKLQMLDELEKIYNQKVADMNNAETTAE